MKLTPLEKAEAERIRHMLLATCDRVRAKQAERERDAARAECARLLADREHLAQRIRDTEDLARAECARLRAVLERLADEASGNDNGSIHFTTLRAEIARLTQE